MDVKKKIGIATAAVLTVGAGVVGGSAIAQASSQDSSQTPFGRPGYGGPGGGPENRSGGGFDRSGHQHTPVTGAELTRVKAAVGAEDSEVAVTQVRKDPDGSYDVFGTKDGAPVMLEVSRDLETITAREGGPGRGGPGGPGGHALSPVTGAELTKVRNAVTAKYDDVTLREVGKAPDGSYGVLATRDGERVMFKVSKDLETITEKTGGPRGDKGAPPAPPAPPAPRQED